MRGRVASSVVRRRRVRLDLLLGALAVLAVIAAVLVHGTASSRSLAPVSPRSVAIDFSRAYAEYLDGRLPASSLPDMSERARAIAGSSSPIPQAAQRGALQLVGVRLTYVRGALSGQAAVQTRDRAHAYGFTLVLRYLSGRWQVVYLVPPDVQTITATAHPQPAAPKALRRIAGAFALAYAGYREGTRPSPPAGSPTIAQQIAGGRDPLARIAPSHAAPKLVSVQVGPAVEGAAAASVVLTDRGRKLRVAFDLQQSGGRWLAWGFPEAG